MAERVTLAMFLFRARRLTTLWNERHAEEFAQSEWAEELAAAYWKTWRGPTIGVRTLTDEASAVGEFASRLPHELVQQITGNSSVKGKGG